jgi:hypothetical protein
MQARVDGKNRRRSAITYRLYGEEGTRIIRIRKRTETGSFFNTVQYEFLRKEEIILTNLNFNL